MPKGRTVLMNHRNSGDQIERALFDQDAELWWSPDCHCALLQSIIPARLEYLQKAYTAKLGRTFRDATVLDVGCGGGLFVEKVARMGCQVTGIDPSSNSIRVAQDHATQAGLDITYRVANSREDDIRAVGAGHDVPEKPVHVHKLYGLCR